MEVNKLRRLLGASGKPQVRIVEAEVQGSVHVRKLPWEDLPVELSEGSQDTWSLNLPGGLHDEGPFRDLPLLGIELPVLESNLHGVLLLGGRTRCQGDLHEPVTGDRLPLYRRLPLQVADPELSASGRKPEGAKLFRVRRHHPVPPGRGDHQEGRRVKDLSQGVAQRGCNRVSVKGHRRNRRYPCGRFEKPQLGRSLSSALSQKRSEPKGSVGFSQGRLEERRGKGHLGGGQDPCLEGDFVTSNPLG